MMGRCRCCVAVGATRRSSSCTPVPLHRHAEPPYGGRRSKPRPLGGDIYSELDSHDVNDPEWQRASKLSREVMWLRKAVHNRASELFCVQLLLGAGAIGVLLVYGRKGRSSAKPDNLRTQADASADHDGNDKGE